MKYFDEYQQVLEEEYTRKLAKAENMGGGNKQKEWMVIRIALTEPKLENEALADKMLKTEKGKKEFVKLLSLVNLDTIKKRCYISERVKRISAVFVRFLDGDKKAAGEFLAYMNQLVEIDRENNMHYFNAKYLLVYLYCEYPKFQTEKLRRIIETYMEGYCTTFLHIICKRVCKRMNYRVKKSTKDVIEKTREALEMTKEECQKDSGEDSLEGTESEVEHLKFQLHNYQDTLSVVQSLFDELKDSVEEAASDAKNNAVSEFFGMLNSSEYGNILDNLTVVERGFAQMRERKVVIPQEVMPLVILFKQLLRFVKNYGIKPIDVCGREFVAGYEDIEFMNFIGQAYADENEKKRVQVTAPGWKYGDVIISVPTVREI